MSEINYLKKPLPSIGYISREKNTAPSLLKANLIFGIHMLWMVIVLFGWAIPGLYWVYLVSLAVNLVLELYFGYCIFTKWEFDIRKKVKTDVEYGQSFIRHYAYQFFSIRITHAYLRPVAISFLIISLVVNFVYLWLV